MVFDTENEIIQLCARGMELEGEGKREEAAMLFDQAWQKATTDLEKFTSAHYVARHQSSIPDKLNWDEVALGFALKIDDPDTKAVLPSLYLNIAKCHEDLRHFDAALKNYQDALSNSSFLPDDGYGNMIRRGIENGLQRVKAVLVKG